MVLEEWLKREGLTKAWLANELGVTRGMVSRWVNGHRTPMLYYAQQIHHLTNGEVTPMDWPTVPPKHIKKSED